MIKVGDGHTSSEIAVNRHGLRSIRQRISARKTRSRESWAGAKHEKFSVKPFMSLALWVYSLDE